VTRAVSAPLASVLHLSSSIVEFFSFFSIVKTCFATLVADHATEKHFFLNPAPEINFPDTYLTFFV